MPIVEKRDCAPKCCRMLLLRHRLLGRARAARDRAGSWDSQMGPQSVADRLRQSSRRAARAFHRGSTSGAERWLSARGGSDWVSNGATARASRVTATGHPGARTGGRRRASAATRATEGASRSPRRSPRARRGSVRRAPAATSKPRRPPLALGRADPRQVAEKLIQIAQCRGRVRALSAFLEFVRGEPAVGMVPAQGLHGALALGVGCPQPRPGARQPKRSQQRRLGWVDVGASHIRSPCRLIAGGTPRIRTRRPLPARCRRAAARR